MTTALLPTLSRRWDSAVLAFFGAGLAVFGIVVLGSAPSMPGYFSLFAGFAMIAAIVPDLAVALVILTLRLADQTPWPPDAEALGSSIALTALLACALLLTNRVRSRRVPLLLLSQASIAAGPFHGQSEDVRRPGPAGPADPNQVRRKAVGRTGRRAGGRRPGWRPAAGRVSRPGPHSADDKRARALVSASTGRRLDPIVLAGLPSNLPRLFTAKCGAVGRMAAFAAGPCWATLHPMAWTDWWRSPDSGRRMTTANEIVGAAEAEVCRPGLRHILSTEDWSALAQASVAEPWMLLAHWADTLQVAWAVPGPGGADDRARVHPGRRRTLSRFVPSPARRRLVRADDPRPVGHVAEGGTDARAWLDHGTWPLTRPMAPRPEPRTLAEPLKPRQC